MTDIRKRDDQSPMGVTIKGSARTGHHVEMANEDVLKDVFRADDDHQANALLSHCFKVLKADEADDAHPSNDDRPFMLSVVNDIAPRDAVERMLAVQMAATHVAMIRSTRWLANSDTLAQSQAHYTGMNKLARTFAAQTETLRKYRNGGKQTMTVQHVNVEDGGQAIVGNVSHRGRGGNER